MRRVVAALGRAVAWARGIGALGPASRVALVIVALGAFAAIGSVAARGETLPAPAAPSSSAAGPSGPASATSVTPAPLAPSALVAAEPAPAPAPAAPAPAAVRGRATPEDPVYLNTASPEDLQRLPGVGPKKAASIVALRHRVGRFRQVDELMRVRGIGRASMKKLRPLVRLDPPAPAPSPTREGGMDAGSGRS